MCRLLATVKWRHYADQVGGTEARRAGRRMGGLKRGCWTAPAIIGQRLRTGVAALDGFGGMQSLARDLRVAARQAQTPQFCASYAFR
jgi:hypothetical protein